MEMISNPVNLIIWIDTTPQKCKGNLYIEKYCHNASFDEESEVGIIDRLDFFLRQWMETTKDVVIIKIDGNNSEFALQKTACEIASVVRGAVDRKKENDRICENMRFCKLK